MKNSKKLWLMLALALVLMCWASCAGADDGILCYNCWTYSCTVTDMGRYHHFECSACGYSYNEDHCSVCTNPGVCEVCGSTDLTGGDSVSHDNIGYTDNGDGETHTMVCSDCGEVFGSGFSHYVECSNPGVCSDCGSTNVAESVEISHSICDRVDNGDGKTHSSICEACGATEVDDHIVYCTEPGICMICFSNYIGEVEYLHDSAWIDNEDGKTHSDVCVNCGEVCWTDTHRVNCMEPGVCDTCGSTDVSGAATWHYSSSCEYIDLGTQHQKVCNDCGYKWDASKHWALCTDTTTCYICKLTGLTLPSSQYSHRGTFTDQGDSHYFECNFCDYTLTGKHYVYCTDQSECYLCGVTGFEITWENRYCEGPLTYLSHDDTKHTFSCGACGETYTEPHEFDDDGSCHCGYEKEETTTRLPGDADDSKGITLSDAYAILNGTASNTSNADVNADGKVDAYDALLILQYLAGWNVTLK